MQLPPQIVGRYELVRELGHGGQGATWLGRSENGVEVVLKVLDFQTLGSWKDLELFQREIAVLRSLDHPAIPTLLDHYSGDNGDDLILIYEFVAGQTMQDLLDTESLMFSEDDARVFTRELLDILTYLHTLNPPVVHRDVKPSNIVRREDGTYALIDFGAAQSSVGLTGGTTFVGTNGYMAPEQLMGRAEPRSDLYSLGATTLHLLTGLHPTLLERSDGGFVYDTELSPSTTEYLAMLTAQIPERRFNSTEQARIFLEERSLVLAEAAPDGLVVDRDQLGLQIAIPAPKSKQGTGGLIYVWFQSIILSISMPELIWANVAILVPATLSWFWLHFLQRRILLTNNGAVYSSGFGILSTTKQWSHGDLVDVSTIIGTTRFQSFVLLQFFDGSQIRVGRGTETNGLRHLSKTIKKHFGIQ